MEIEIESPKLDMLYAGIGVVVLTIALLYLFKGTVQKPLPETFILAVPFTPQAPTNNWNRNEDCEETSITMANAFLNGEQEDRMPAPLAQAAIDNLKKWEQANLGYNANTGADATQKMAEGAFSLKIRQIPNYTENDLKKALVNSQPILLPINARLLNNPKYFDNGPLYHMIIVRGYKSHTFIVNDPGTDSGDGNEYSFSTLHKAAADWNQATKKMDPNRKVALIVSK